MEGYFDLESAKAENPGKYDNETLQSWLGIGDSEVPNQEVLEFYRQNVLQKEGKYISWSSIFTEVAYWRKANQIHRWFVENVQEGEDDCGNYEVEREDLEKLLNICKKIQENAVMFQGQVVNGYRFVNGKEEPILEDGLKIVNPEFCKKFLPTQGGFFFGETDYDQWYMQSIGETIIQLEKVIAETDWEKEIVFYHSSW